MSDLATQGMTAIQASRIRTPAATGSKASIQAKAQEFEGVFVAQMLGQMFEGVSTDGPFGGGQGEQMFRSLMMDEYGKQIASQGGIGIASSVSRELLKHQEMAAAAANATSDTTTTPTEVTKQ